MPINIDKKILDQPGAACERIGAPLSRRRMAVMKPMIIVVSQHARIVRTMQRQRIANPAPTCGYVLCVSREVKKQSQIILTKRHGQNIIS